MNCFNKAILSLSIIVIGKERVENKTGIETEIVFKNSHCTNRYLKRKLLVSKQQESIKDKKFKINSSESELLVCVEGVKH